mgnify:FL=1
MLSLAVYLIPVGDPVRWGEAAWFTDVIPAGNSTGPLVGEDTCVVYAPDGGLPAAAAENQKTTLTVQVRLYEKQETATEYSKH